MRANRLVSVGLVFLIVSTSWLAIGHLGSGISIASPGYYLNVNQEVVPPGGSFSVYANYQKAPIVQLVRVEPRAFSTNQTTAIQQGTIVEQRSVDAATATSG